TAKNVRRRRRRDRWQADDDGTGGHQGRMAVAAAAGGIWAERRTARRAGGQHPGRWRGTPLALGGVCLHPSPGAGGHPHLFTVTAEGETTGAVLPFGSAHVSPAERATADDGTVLGLTPDTSPFGRRQQVLEWHQAEDPAV